METVKALAESNLLVSEAKNKLFDIKKKKELIIETPPKEEPIKEEEELVVPSPVKLQTSEGVERVISEQQMTSVKALAETNIKISEAKNILYNLNKDESEYIKTREAKVIARISELYQQSKNTLDEINKNYEGVYTIFQMASEATTFLKENQNLFKDLLETFEEKNTQWKKDVSEQEERLVSLKKGLDQEKVNIINEKKSIELVKAAMVQERRKIADDRATLERAFSRINKK